MPNLLVHAVLARLDPLVELEAEKVAVERLLPLAPLAEMAAEEQPVMQLVA